VCAVFVDLCPTCKKEEIVLKWAGHNCVQCTHINVYVLGCPKVGSTVHVYPQKSSVPHAYIVCHIKAEQKFRNKTHICVAYVGPLEPASHDYMESISS